MKTNEQICAAESIADKIQDYLILAKTQKKLKDADLIETQINYLKDTIVALAEEL